MVGVPVPSGQMVATSSEAQLVGIVGHEVSIVPQ